MKPLFCLITFFLAAHLFSQTDEWRNIGSEELKTYYYKPHSKDKAWIKIESAQLDYIDNKGNNKIVDGYQLNLWHYNCDEKQIGIVQLTTYDKAGNVLRSFSRKSYEIEPSYVNPNSLGEYFLQVFCGN